MSLSKEAANLTEHCEPVLTGASRSQDLPPMAFSVRFRPPREGRGVFSLLGRDALWGDIRKLFERRNEELSGQEWTPAMVREVEKSLLEESSDLRGSFLGCLRHLCDMELCCQKGMTIAEANFLHRLQRRLESRTPFLKGAFAKHSEEMLRESSESGDWKDLVALCDLARVLGARMGRHPLYQSLASDAIFWEVLLGIALQARSWNRLHKGASRSIRPLDIYIGACVVPSEGGVVPSLSQMRQASSASWMSGALDRWLQAVAQEKGDSLIPGQEWSPPWSWLRQAADQIQITPMGTRGAVVGTVVRALQETGWDADRPKEGAAAQLLEKIEALASRYVPDPVSRPTPSVSEKPVDHFETGMFSIFDITGEGPAVVDATRDAFRDDVGKQTSQMLASLENGATIQGRVWWSDFLTIVEREDTELQRWAARMREIDSPLWICGFEDAVRFLYPSAVRPAHLSFHCTDRYPPEPRENLDIPVVEFLLSACEESLASGARQPPLVVARHWQAQTEARMLPSHSPGWWSWIAQEGTRRAYSPRTRGTLPAPGDAFARDLAIPSLASEEIAYLEACVSGNGGDPAAVQTRLAEITANLESSKELALRSLLTRF